VSGLVLAVPHPGLPPQAGEGDAATCSFLTDMWQQLPPPLMEVCTLSPIPAFPRKRGKETLPHAASSLTCGSIFLPH